MKKLTLFILSAMLLLSSCGAGRENVTEKSSKLCVYTSFYAMYDFAKLIGGDRIDVYSMCPSSSEPHDYEPKTSDMAKLSEADVFIYSGMGMESWAEKTVSSLKSSSLKVVEASDNIPYTAENYDPHVWLNPENALHEMENIKNAFCEKDSENADYYNSNFKDCKEKTEKLINDYKTAAASFKDRNVVVAHAAYGYLCDAFNLNQTSIENASGEGEPSPARMAEIIDFVKNNNIKYIFSQELETTKTVEAVAKETGAEILSLNPFEGDDSGADYFTVMEENLEVLKKALN